MINLLPPQQKEDLLVQERFKIILILGIVIVSLLLSFGLILFTIKTLILTDLQIQKAFLEQKEKELKNPKMQVLEEKIKEYNLTLLELNNFYQNQKNLTTLLEKFPKILPDKIYLTALNFNSSGQQISLAGYCPSREILLEFRKNLEEVEDFKEIYFPPTSWVEPTNINFTVTFKLK